MFNEKSSLYDTIPYALQKFDNQNEVVTAKGEKARSLPWLS